MAITIDGPNLTITINSIGTIGVLTIYSEWKEWFIDSDNSKYPPAFRVIGGDPLGGGLNAGSYVFLQNQDGWRIKPAEQDGETVITGNLFAEDATIALFIPTEGDFNTNIRLQTSSLTQTQTIVSGSGVTEQDKLDIADKVWDKPISEHQTPGTFGKYVQDKILNVVRFLGLN
jgi:hypothetical protein